MPILPQHIARVVWYRYQLGGGTDTTVEQLMHCLARTKQRKQQAQAGPYTRQQYLCFPSMCPGGTARVEIKLSTYRNVYQCSFSPSQLAKRQSL